MAGKIVLERMCFLENGLRKVSVYFKLFMCSMEHLRNCTSSNFITVQVQCGMINYSQCIHYIHNSNYLLTFFYIRQVTRTVDLTNAENKLY